MKIETKVLDSFQIAGFVISTTVSLILVILKQDTVISLILGLILATMVQLFDLQLRQANSEERILHASVLNRKLYQDNWLLTHIQEIVENYFIANDVWFKQFGRESKEAITECRGILHALSEGYMIIPPRSPYTLGTNAINEYAKQSIKAIDLTDASYWRTAYSANYWEAHKNAIKRGVKIIRIFIQPRDSMKDISDVLEKQNHVGIDVYFAAVEDIPVELIEDVLIMDDCVFSRSELTSDRRYREERITIDTVEVEQAVRRFNTLLRYTQKLENVSKA
jgi:hypothetical protein